MCDISDRMFEIYCHLAVSNGIWKLMSLGSVGSHLAPLQPFSDFGAIVQVPEILTYLLLIIQEGQHPLTGQPAANFRLLANQ